MAFINTYTGKLLDPTSPDPKDIDITDIAHALSMLCRAGGHFKYFHSVAKHCISCAKEAKARGLSRRIQLACLLHDGSEAYIADITRPVKSLLADYKRYEDIFQTAIWKKWLCPALTEEEIKTVFEIDDNMLYYEFKHFTGKQLWNTSPVILTKPCYDSLPFENVEMEFKAIFNTLI